MISTAPAKAQYCCARTLSSAMTDSSTRSVINLGQVPTNLSTKLEFYDANLVLIVMIHQHIIYTDILCTLVLNMYILHYHVFCLYNVINYSGEYTH
jgi:hypothetical protein